MNQRTKIRETPIFQEYRGADRQESPVPTRVRPVADRSAGAGGMLAGVLLALLILLAVSYVGYEASGAGTDIHVDVPGAPTQEVEPSG